MSSIEDVTPPGHVAEAASGQKALAPSAATMSSAFDPSLLSVGEILNLYSSLLGELRRRGLVRTNNAPIGDLAEYACAAFYRGQLAPNSEKSFDLTAADGRRVQVKVRTVLPGTNPAGTFSAIRSMDFDICVFVLADAQTNTIAAAWEWTAEEIRTYGRFGNHTNSTVVRMNRVRSGIAGVDVTAGVNAAWQLMLGLTGAP